MNDLAIPVPHISPMDANAIGKVRDIEDKLLELPQLDIKIEQMIHDGVYSRTVMLPAGSVVTGALVVIPTTLVVVGDVSIYVGTEVLRLTGHHVIKAEAGRKQVFYAHADTWLTMLFKTNAQTVEEAEAQFTDEPDKLTTRRQN